MRRRRGLPGGFDHGFYFRGLDTGHQGLERVQLVVGQQGPVVGPGQRGDVEEGFGGGGQLRQHRLEEDHQLAEQVDAQAADGLDLVLLAFLLGQRPGACSAIQALARSARAMISRMARLKSRAS